eukprot:TRINITY_DN8189_c0_g1_i1.p1 TRINITY_DN8189_c0_g1~~TRINITY_DN8189_c0_g1_i1.p1  ORF type:complete len:605 (-),score=146.46 TRINITY_DN8189_c0_g1_i1:31-1719(-)
MELHALLLGDACSSVDGTRLASLLRRLREEAEAAHRELTALWGGPLSLPAASAQIDASEVPQLAVETAGLCDLAQSYELQVLSARRDRRRLQRMPLLELARRLRAVTRRLRSLAERLRSAQADAEGASSLAASYHACGEGCGAAAVCRPAALPPEVILEGGAAGGSSSSSGGRRRPHASSPAASAAASASQGAGDDPVATLLGALHWSTLSDRLRRSLESCIDVVSTLAKLAELPRALTAARHAPKGARPGGVKWQLLTSSVGLPGLAEPAERFSASVGSVLAPRNLPLAPRSAETGTGAVAASAGTAAWAPKGALQLTTGYWNFRGLGAPMRMMCAYAQLGKSEHEDVKYEVWPRARGGGWIDPEWESCDKPELREQNSFAQLPYVIDHTAKVVICGSIPCYSYLGRVLGLAGGSWRERNAAEQALAFVHGMQMDLFNICYPFKGNRDELDFEAALRPHFGEALPSCYERLESWLQLQNGAAEPWGFLAGGAGPTAADFVLLEVLDQNEALAKSQGYGPPLSDFDILRAYYRNLCSASGLRNYFESYDATLPFNNKMAFFK